MDESASVLAPALLIAMPQLRDPNFARTVVLLCEHGPAGAMGFVVNRPTETLAAEAVAMDPPIAGDSGMRLWTGGPVERHRGFLLLGKDPGRGDSEQITDGFHLTASLAVLRDLLEATPERLGHTRARLLLGYAGWGPGSSTSSSPNRRGSPHRPTRRWSSKRRPRSCGKPAFAASASSRCRWPLRRACSSRRSDGRA